MSLFAPAKLKSLFSGKTILSPLGAGFLLSALLIAWGYGDTCQFPFIFDDVNGIVNNPAIASFGIEGLRGILQFGAERILGLISFVVSWAISGPDPCAFRQVNFVVHALSAGFSGMVALNLARLLQWRLARRSEYLLVVLVAGLFAAHPMQTQAVTYIYQRLASLAGCLGLAGFAFFSLWLCGRRAWAWWISFLLVALAMMTKPNVATLPILFFLGSYGFCRDRASMRGAAWFFFLPLIIPILMMAGSGVASRVASHGVQGLGVWDYFLVQGRVVWGYLVVILWPPLQSLDHVIRIPGGMGDPLAWWGLAGWLCVVLSLMGAMVVVKNWRLPAWSRLSAFGICWFFCNLLVESSFFPIRDLMMEHRAYLPFAGVGWLAGSCGVALVERLNLDSRRYLLAFAAAILCLLGVASLSEKRNRVWESAESLWSSVLVTDPGSLRARLNLGNALFRDGRYEEALVRYAELAALIENYPPALHTSVVRELPYQQTMTLVLLRRFDEASASAERLAEVISDDPYRIAYVRGFIAYARGDYREALVALPEDSTSGALARDIAMTRARAAERRAADTSLAQREREALLLEVFQSLEKILLAAPHDPEAIVRMAKVLALSGKPEAAQAILREALVGSSASVLPWLMVTSGELLEDPLRPESALNQYRQAIKRFPRHPGIKIWYGSFLAMLGDHDAIHQLIGGAGDVDILADYALAQAARLSGSLQFDESVNLLTRALRLCESGPRKCSHVAALAESAARNLLLANPAARDEAENLMARGRSVAAPGEVDGSKP